MEKMTASRLLLCVAALMALSGILMAVCGRFVCAPCLFAAAPCMLGTGLAFRAADKTLNRMENTVRNNNSKELQ